MTVTPVAKWAMASRKATSSYGELGHRALPSECSRSGPLEEKGAKVTPVRVR